jgi:hypothetical protein
MQFANWRRHAHLQGRTARQLAKHYDYAEVVKLLPEPESPSQLPGSEAAGSAAAAASQSEKQVAPEQGWRCA